jgi:hypothetical protein
MADPAAWLMCASSVCVRRVPRAAGSWTCCSRRPGLGPAEAEAAQAGQRAVGADGRWGSAARLRGGLRSMCGEPLGRTANGAHGRSVSAIVMQARRCASAPRARHFRRRGCARDGAARAAPVCRALTVAGALRRAQGCCELQGMGRSAACRVWGCQGLVGWWARGLRPTGWRAYTVSAHGHGAHSSAPSYSCAQQHIYTRTVAWRQQVCLVHSKGAGVLACARRGGRWLANALRGACVSDAVREGGLVRSCLPRQVTPRVGPQSHNRKPKRSGAGSKHYTEQQRPATGTRSGSL